MKFDELDAKMRVYETALDIWIPPEFYIVARLDGRSFTHLTKEVHEFEAPFDTRFRDYMIGTVKHLMTCGFRVVYGYTESDEISLLFHMEENAFGRKLRKLHSILAGEASARFSLLLGDVGVFDCRISVFPNKNLVVDYFRWRNEDAHRNALNAHCYWMMRKNGYSANESTTFLNGKSIAEKNEYLFQNGVNFNEVPAWQKRGIGLYWEDCEKVGMNPVTGKAESALRRCVKTDMELPMKDAYGAFLEALFTNPLA